MGNGQASAAMAPEMGSEWSPELQANVRKELVKIMNDPKHDDGSFAPLWIRLAWHSSGTFDAMSATGGSNGATMRHKTEASDPENAGLDYARKVLETVKQKFPEISYADLWVFAAYVGIEETGGPTIPFHSGRVDKPEAAAIQPGRLPGAEKGLEEGFKTDAEGRILHWEKLCKHIRDDIFYRMGFNDKEIVALLCGGHVYGRCHTEYSGYAGAWVENPTYFSNEYAADLIGDRWMAAMKDTKMPDGGEVPEEVRPAKGKIQYVNLTKYEPDEDEDAKKEEVKAPDAKDFPPGKYVCVSDWVNSRESPDVTAPIIGRFVKDQEIQMHSVKVFGTAMRARTERGGWVSLKASGGKTLFERKGDLDLQLLKGRYRVAADAKAGITGSSTASAKADGKKYSPGGEFEVSEVVKGTDNNAALYGKVGNEFVMIFSPEKGTLADLIVEGYNEMPRAAIKGQSGHQMMLVSDMVLLWDEKFRVHVERYAEDVEILKTDFGLAYKRLTELGCPWSPDAAVKGFGGCPFAAC